MDSVIECPLCLGDGAFLYFSEIHGDFDEDCETCEGTGKVDADFWNGEEPGIN